MKSPEPYRQEARRHYDVIVEYEGREVEATLIAVCGDDGIILDIVFKDDIIASQGMDMDYLTGVCI